MEGGGRTAAQPMEEAGSEQDGRYEAEQDGKHAHRGASDRSVVQRADPRTHAGAGVALPDVVDWLLTPQ